MVTENKNLEQAIQQLQVMQQRVAVFSQQKQQFQIQLMEIENALKEVDSAKSLVFKMTGGIMIEKTSAQVTKELSQTKEDLDLKIRSLENQESKSHSKMIELQQELSKELK